MASPSPTFSQSLIAGGVAGTAVDLLFYPIDTFKTRLQSPQGFWKAGAFSGVYRGIGSVVIGSAPGAAAFFTTYDSLKKYSPLPTHLSSLTHMASASIAEIVACLVRVPTEVIKSRAQTSISGAQAGSSFAHAKLVFKNDGFKGFYRGYGTTVMREIPFTSVQFPLYEFLKLRLSSELGRKPLEAHEAALCGSIAGGFAAAVTTPLDVLKTRVMLDLRRQGSQEIPSAMQRLRQIYAMEGIGALFAGVVPRTLWISAGGAVFLGAYEWTIRQSIP